MELLDLSVDSQKELRWSLTRGFYAHVQEAPPSSLPEAVSKAVDNEEEDEEVYPDWTDNPIDLEERLNNVNYSFLEDSYKPSEFALHFIAFIKLVNGPEGEEHKSPLIHYDMLDQLAIKPDKWFVQNLFVSFRGSAKTTALHEYMILYLATYGSIPGFGEVNVGMYISDTMENGVKSMRNNLEFRWNNSEFLQKYVPEARFTDIRWEFKNADGKKLAFRGFGATTGVRGFKEYGERPSWCGMDDLMSDKNAESPTITQDIKKIVYRAARQAMHPTKRMQLWTGTPFNKSDPLYEAASSGAWNTRVYPICEKFPCAREEFRGAWEDRFPYEFVKHEYDSLLASGEIASFNQELMLRITSDEDRLVQDTDIIWYRRESILSNKRRYNFYITTDFATAEGKKADFSVISVWAYTNNGEWLLVDGMCRRQLMDKNVDALFNFVSVYHPLSVGVEINGQQKGFISWLKSEMINRNIFFNLARQGKQEGIRRHRDKISNFKLFVPTIKAGKFWMPEDLKDHPLIVEMVEELRYATEQGFKSKHDDAADTVSMLLDMNPFKPSLVSTPERKFSEDGQFAWFLEDEHQEVERGSTVF